MPAYRMRIFPHVGTAKTASENSQESDNTVPGKFRPALPVAVLHIVGKPEARDDAQSRTIGEIPRHRPGRGSDPDRRHGLAVFALGASRRWDLRQNPRCQPARRGNSSRIIRAKLKQKGLGGDIIDQALAALSDDDEDPERTAAIRFARRRRLGPFSLCRSENNSKETQREKHLAAMARAGFSYGIARHVIDAGNEDDLLS